MQCSQKTLSDLGEIITGKTPSTKNLQFWNGEIPFVTPKDIQATKHIFHTERNITHLGLSSVDCATLPIGSICVSCIGYIGYIGITTKKCVSNQQINSIIVNQENDRDFVYYLLKNLWSYFKNYEGQSTALSILNKSQFSKIQVDVPLLNVQKRIADILSKIDDKIELNNAINHNLQQQAEILFKAWFVEYEPFGGIKPIDWEITCLDNIAKDIVCGKTPPTKQIEYYGDDIPFITIPDMHNNIYIIKTEKSLSNLGAKSQVGKTLPPNSICVSCIGTAGLVSLVSSPSQTNQQINSIIPKDDISPFFIYLLMRTLSNKIQNLGASGSTICNLNKGQFAKMEIVMPKRDIISNFHDIVAPMFEAIKQNQYENERLETFRDTLLPKLMSSEIDVSDVEI